MKNVMKKAVAILLACTLIVGITGCAKAPTKTESAGESAVSESKSALKMAWYAPAPHPYFDEVKKGVEQFIEKEGVDVTIQIGPDWTQASENEKVEALIAQGINALSIYPCDASGANGLYDEITKKMGVNVVNFGTDTSKPTAASFAVGTDVKKAAYDATEAVIKMMGEKGNLVNVLEVLEDPNTALRKQGVEEAVAKYPNVKIIQEVAGIKTQEEAVSKIESVLSANAGKVNGMVCTGFVTTVGMSQILSDYYAKNKDQKIYAIGIDTDPGVMKAIESGIIDATIAQNPLGHGYISCMLLKLMNEGYKAKDGQYFINSGNVLVTKENMTSFEKDLEKVTDFILLDLTKTYLSK